MMNRPGRSNDVVIRVVPAVRRGRERSDDDLAHQMYDALVYSALPLTMTATTATHYPPEEQNLPLVGVESIRLSMSDYQHVLASFLEGDKGATIMRQRLLEAMSPPLRKVLTEAPFDMSVWWSHAARELEEFPWELTGDPGGHQSGHRLVFVRGRPPVTPLPAIPIVDVPRVAALGCPDAHPEWAERLTASFSKHVRVIDAPIRQGIETAVRERCEIVHLFTDGRTSAALEGILYDRNAEPESRQLHPSEISRMLSGTRVALLALSPAHQTRPEAMDLAGRRVLSAFRAFAYLGASPLVMPSIITQLGPVPDELMLTFWHQFYLNLFQTWHLTESLRQAQKSLPYPAPIALFCRHAGGKLFRMVTSEAASEHPVLAQADLVRSQKLTSDLSAFSEKWGEAQLPDAVRKLLHDEREHQVSLRGELDDWVDAEEEL
jgi:hypothetical protein